MKKSLWLPAKTKYLGKYASIVHSATGEMAVYCKYGEVWAYDNSCSSALVTSAKVAKSINYLLNGLITLKTNLGAEYVFRFHNDYLPTILKLLGYRNNKVSMARKANKGR